MGIDSKAVTAAAKVLSKAEAKLEKLKASTAKRIADAAANATAKATKKYADKVVAAEKEVTDAQTAINGLIKA